MINAPEATSASERRIHDAALRLYATTGRTDLTVSELAQEAGVARGTVYNYVQATDALFESVTARLTGEMYRRVNKSIATTAHADDPVARLAIGMRLYIRRAHEEPQWGKFIYSFGFRTKVLQELWNNDPMQDLAAGVKAGRFQIPPHHLGASMSFVAGVVIAAMHLVSMGHETWRNAGTHAVEFVLQALGIPAETAASLATQELPDLMPDE